MQAPREPVLLKSRASDDGTVAPVDVLEVNAENRAAWAELRAIVRAWQSLARRHGWVK